MDFEQMYRDYIMSDRKCELLIDETGYVEYQTLGTDFCVGAIYLKPEYRGAKIEPGCPFEVLFLKAFAIGKERGCTRHLHFLKQSNPAKDRILRYMLYHGMKLSHNHGDTLVLYKEM